MFCFLAIERVEDTADRLGDFALHRLARYVFLGILLNVELATLPGYRGKDGRASGFEAFVSIGDEQLNAVTSCSDSATETPKTLRLP